MSELKTYEGDSGQIWEVGYKDTSGAYVTLDANYTCNLVVVRLGETDATVNREITLKNTDSTAFIAALEEAETTTLGAGKINVALYITNTTTNPTIRRRNQFQYEIERGGLPEPV